MGMDLGIYEKVLVRAKQAQMFPKETHLSRRYGGTGFRAPPPIFGLWRFVAGIKQGGNVWEMGNGTADGEGGEEAKFHIFSTPPPSIMIAPAHTHTAVSIYPERDERVCDGNNAPPETMKKHRYENRFPLQTFRVE